MNTQQIVVISGKTCSGKSSLSALLVKEFGFRALSSREVLLEKSNGDLSRTLTDRAKLARFGSELNRSSESEWLLDAAKGLTNSGALKQSIVIDHASRYSQVQAFRKHFGSRLIHVHLYASRDTLLNRFQQNSENGGLDYDDIDHLTNDDDIKLLKTDADVRIYTSKTDSRDTLVRVASRLHLYAPPTVRCVDVLIGGQYGSEGKGNVVSYLSKEYDVMVRVGGPNAGHTVADSAGTYTHHHLPSGARDIAARLILGPGMTIRVEKLLKEIAECHITPDRLFIDPQATIITDEDVDNESQRLVGEIGSTGSGSGAASARRILDRGIESTRLAKDIPELALFVGDSIPYRGRTVDRLEEAYQAGQSILLEGTQGSGLSIYHGTYPYVTSRDTNVAGCLAEAGISPSRIRKILMVVRSTPIRVGDPDGDGGFTSGPLRHQTSFDEVAVQSNGLDADALYKAEKTSTTKRDRRVGWFEWTQFRDACALNAPTDIVLTFADYLAASNREARRFEQLDSDTIKFVEELERVAQAPVSMINIRFPREASELDDLRTIIDRRNWTGRSH